MEIHIGDRIADITLVGKEGNKVQLTIDGKPYDCLLYTSDAADE